MHAQARTLQRWSSFAPVGNLAMLALVIDDVGLRASCRVLGSTM